MTIRHSRQLVPLLTLAATLCVGSCARDTDPTVTLSGLTMGTTWSVKVVPDDPTVTDEEALWDLVNDQLTDVNQRMSHYLDTSELSRFNMSTSTTSVPISPELAQVIAEALRVGTVTDGALDITVGPLVDAWGFGPPGEPAEPPSDEEIVRLRATTGLEHLDLDRDKSTLRKDHPNVRIDLASIAKGYGVDKVCGALLDAGYRNFMVEIGGEVRVRGHRADGKPWHLAIERPQTRGRALYGVLTLDTASLATSGDYRNFRVVAGRRISHIIDPRTGRPVEHTLGSVSVIDSLCMTADAFATALFVLGPDEGFDLAEKLGLAALFLTYDDRGHIEERATSRFEKIPLAATR